MEIEVEEFYPIEVNKEKGTLRGTLHVYLTEEDIDIRGIYVKKEKKHWFFGMPQAIGKDHETGERVRYPTFHFTGQKKHKELIGLLREKGKAYIENFLEERHEEFPNGQRPKEVLDVRCADEVEAG